MEAIWWGVLYYYWQLLFFFCISCDQVPRQEKRPVLSGIPPTTCLIINHHAVCLPTSACVNPNELWVRLSLLLLVRLLDDN